MNGHTGTAQLLISSGANIDITDKVSSDIKLLHFVNILMTITVKNHHISVHVKHHTCPSTPLTVNVVLLTSELLTIAYELPIVQHTCEQIYYIVYTCMLV